MSPESRRRADEEDRRRARSEERRRAASEERAWADSQERRRAESEERRRAASQERRRRAASLERRRRAASAERRRNAQAQFQPPPQFQPPQPHLTFEQQCAAWSRAATLAFSDYPSLRAFPEPPFRQCWQSQCTMNSGNRVLRACPCNLTDLCRAMRLEDLKRLRLQLHPDRFWKCPEGVREGLQRVAAEVFGVAQEVWLARSGGG